jgi:hypothetical protein
VKIRLITLCSYAALSDDKRLTIAGTFNGNNVSLPEDAPEDAKIQNVMLPAFYLVIVAEVSIGEGTVHRCELRINDDDGKAVTDPIDLGEWRFITNPHGRAMTYNSVNVIQGFVAPRPGDYSFELWAKGKLVYELPFYITEVPRGQA